MTQKSNLNGAKFQKMYEEVFKDHMRKDYFRLWFSIMQTSAYNSLKQYLDYHYKSKGMSIRPLPQQIWSAFNQHDLRDLKVVILGNAPYYYDFQGQPVANGLAFDCNLKEHTPIMLRKIKHIARKQEFKGIWGEELAKQGVLLLNTSLTCAAGRPNSHNKYWMPVMRQFISLLSASSTRQVWMLWGNRPQQFIHRIVSFNCHLVLSTQDLTVNKNRDFQVNNHFEIANRFLQKEKKGTINW